MADGRTYGWPDLQTTDPLMEIWSGLQAQEGHPPLVDLARQIVDAFCHRPTVSLVTVAADHDGGTLLEPTWSRRTRTCLVHWTGDAEPRWIVQPDAFTQLINQSTAGQLTTARGNLPGFSAWPADGGSDDTASVAGWLLAPILCDQQPLMAVALGLTSPTVETVEEAGHLLRLQAGLTALTTFWVETVDLRSQLRRTRTENRALNRLNHLQGRFVAMASHEFKTPLTSITAYTDVLRGHLTDAEFPHATEFLGVIRTEAGRLLRMANRILDYSRMELGKELLDSRPQDIGPLITETLRTLRPNIAAKNQTVAINVEPGLPQAEVDPDLIRQVLVNLIGNAVKYTPERGCISVDLTEIDSALRIAVTDTGPGIAPHDLRRIFHEFYRAQGTAEVQEGSGLGLSIVRHILNLHGGHITVTSGPEGGSCFAIQLPKEVTVADPLPALLTDVLDQGDARRLLQSLLCLLAEMTASPTVVLQLSGGTESCAMVAGLGPDLGALQLIAGCEDRQSHRMCTKLELSPEVFGYLRVQRRNTSQTYKADDLSQLQVLAQVVTHTLQAVLGLTGPRTKTPKVIEALQMLLQARRHGIPTATAEALHLTRALAEELALESSQIDRLLYAAALHDAGMARVEDEIMMGQQELDWDERDEVDRHVEQGVDLLEPLLPDPRVTDIIRHHHERLDGSGYPDGLRGEDIPLESRVLAVIDAWFSLTRERPFRSGLPATAAIAEIKDHVGTQFDARVTDVFIDVLKTESVLSDDTPVPTNR